MPEITSLRLDGLGLTNPVLGVVTSNTSATNNAGVTRFTKTVVITSAAVTTPVTILADGEVGTGRKVYIESVMGYNTGATGWPIVNTESLQIRDTNSSPVTFWTQLYGTGAATSIPGSGRLLHQSTGTTLGAAMLDHRTATGGGTAGKGIVLLGTGAAASGSDVLLKVTGYIA